MKEFLNFLPLIAFFFFYKCYDIYVATITIIVTNAILVVYNLLYFHKLEKKTLINFIILSVFGGLTIFFHDDRFIKWKVTIIYLMLACIILIGQCFFKKTIIKSILNIKYIKLPKRTWVQLNIAWAIFFIICGITNIYIALSFSQDAWVNFKVFGLTTLLLIFTALNGIYIFYILYRNKNNCNSTNSKTNSNIN